MSNQLQITGGAKVRNLEGVLTGTTGVVSSLGINVPNGIPQLDTNGKILVSQLPNSVMEYLGTWNAATNTPTLVNGTGNAGDVYLCSVAGTVNFGAGPISFVVSDQVIYSGTIWQKASGTNGTVTSISVTESGDALSITGSPVTTSGTINIGFAGTSAQYVAGDGSLITFPALTGYVPYTGATSDVDLGAFSLNAKSLHIKGVGGNGHLGLKHQSATPTGSANESLLFADANGNFGWQNDNLYLTTLSTHANTANRTYTFPNASGTLALTTDLANFTANSPLSYSGGVLSISQANTSTNGYLSSTDWNTFNNKQNALGFIPINGSGSINYISKFTGSTTISQSGIYEGITNYVSIGNTNTTYNLDVTGTFRLTSNAIFGGTLGNGTYTYTLPSATGTLALTSQLSAYVPYTGATADVDLGTYNFKANKLSIPSAGSSNQLTSFANTTSLHSGSAGLNVFGFNGSNNIYFGKGLSNGGVILWTNSQVRYYTLPDADGTVALTSNLGAYLPLTGGTLTGALNGTTISTSGSATFGSDVFTYANGGIFFNGGGSYTSGIFQQSGGNLILQTGTTPRLTIASTGAATFSSSVTANNLTIGPSTTFSTLNFNYNGTNNKGGIAINYSTGEYQIWAGESGNGYYQTFYTNATERMRITSGGLVGIGISSPDTLLHIAGTQGTLKVTSNSTSGANAPYLSFFHAGNDEFKIVGGGYLAFLSSGTTERMRLTATGVLDLSGNNDVVSVNDKFSMGVFSTSYAWLQSFGGRSIYLNKAGNAVYAGTQRIDNNSDERIKENIVPIENALTTILSLNGRKFNMLDEDNILRYGFIAQEVKPHLADFVTESERSFEKDDIKIENLLTLESSGAAWAALLVEAIKELKQEIDELKNK